MRVESHHRDAKTTLTRIHDYHTVCRFLAHTSVVFAFAVAACFAAFAAGVVVGSAGFCCVAADAPNRRIEHSATPACMQMGKRHAQVRCSVAHQGMESPFLPPRSRYADVPRRLNGEEASEPLETKGNETPRWFTPQCEDVPLLHHRILISPSAVARIRCPQCRAGDQCPPKHRKRRGQ